MKSSLWIGLAVAALLGLLGSVYVVREDQTAMVLNLGKVVRADIKPGLHFKVPLVESVRVFDRRFQVLDTAPARYFTAEQKDVSVDFFAIGRISDVRNYYRATGAMPPWPMRAWHRSSPTRCATRSTRAPCSSWCRVIAAN